MVGLVEVCSQEQGQQSIKGQPEEIHFPKPPQTGDPGNGYEAQ